MNTTTVDEINQAEGRGQDSRLGSLRGKARLAGRFARRDITGYRVGIRDPRR